MKMYGRVIKTEGEFAFVSVARESSCQGGCASCAGCSVAKDSEIKVLNACGAKAGENVLVKNSSAKKLLLAFITYVMPLVLFFISAYFNIGDAQSVAVLLASFALCAFFANTLAKKKYFMSTAERE